jgi:hypothetical protein
VKLVLVSEDGNTAVVTNNITEWNLGRRLSVDALIDCIESQIMVLNTRERHCLK